MKALDKMNGGHYSVLAIPVTDTLDWVEIFNSNYTE